MRVKYEYHPKYCEKPNHKVYWFTKKQYNKLLGEIHSALLTQEIIDNTIPTYPVSICRNRDWRDTHKDEYDALIDLCEGDICNILKRIHKDEFVKMDVVLGRYYTGPNGNVVYLYEHTEYLNGREVILYIKFSFGSDNKVHLLSCHEEEYPLTKIPPLL